MHQRLLPGDQLVEQNAHRPQIAALVDVLRAQLLGLLVAFIGQGLTVRLVREIWPQLSIEDLDSINGGKK